MDFPATSWTVIRHAQDPESPEYERHASRLVQLYWRPVFLVIRHSWRKSPDEAKDLTQEFFATNVFQRRMVDAASPDRGSFRAFLRTSVGHFMSDARRDANRQKRGGGTRAVSIDAGDVDAGELAAAATVLSPEQAFDLAWNRTVVERAIGTLRERLAAAGREPSWEVFRRYELDGERERLSYDDLGQQLGMTGRQVKHALHATRAAFKDCVTDVVREYVGDADDLASELRALFGEK